MKKRVFCRVLGFPIDLSTNNAPSSYHYKYTPHSSNVEGVFCEQKYICWSTNASTFQSKLFYYSSLTVGIVVYSTLLVQVPYMVLYISLCDKRSFKYVLHFSNACFHIYVQFNKVSYLELYFLLRIGVSPLPHPIMRVFLSIRIAVKCALM